jgi:hypothetical protein
VNEIPHANAIKKNGGIACGTEAAKNEWYKILFPPLEMPLPAVKKTFIPDYPIL